MRPQVGSPPLDPAEALGEHTPFEAPRAGDRADEEDEQADEKEPEEAWCADPSEAAGPFPGARKQLHNRVRG